jgi:hypothetical protein
VGDGATGENDVQLESDLGNISFIANNGVVMGNTAYFNTSDRTLKMNIEPLQGALERLALLTGVRYQWRPDYKPRSPFDLGVIAQDVERVFPELVVRDSKGLLAVNYAGFVAPFLESINELGRRSDHQRGRAEDQQREIIALREEVSALHARLAALEQLVANAAATARQ